MATYTGDTGTIKVGAETIGEIKSWSYEVSAASIDTTVMGGDGWASFKSGQKAWTGTAELLVEKTDAGQLELGAGETKSGVEFLFDATDATSIAAKGTALIESVSVSSSVGEMVTLSVSFKGSSALDTNWQG
jgi:hypothetical protein